MKKLAFPVSCCFEDCQSAKIMMCRKEIRLNFGQVETKIMIKFYFPLWEFWGSCCCARENVCWNSFERKVFLTPPRSFFSRRSLWIVNFVGLGSWNFGWQRELKFIVKGPGWLCAINIVDLIVLFRIRATLRWQFVRKYCCNYFWLFWRSFKFSFKKKHKIWRLFTGNLKFDGYTKISRNSDIQSFFEVVTLRRFLFESFNP